MAPSPVLPMRESAGGPMARAEERPYGQAPTGGQARDMKQWEIRSAIAADAMMTPVPHAAPSRGEVLLAQLPIVVWTTDSVLTFTSSDGSGLDELTLGPDQIVGLTLFDLFDTDDPRLPAISAHVRALNGETVSFDMRLADRAFHGRVSPLKDGEGEQIGTICAVIEEGSADIAVLEASALVTVE